MIEEASGIGTTRSFVLEELRLAVEDSPKRDEIVNDYAELLDEERRLQIDNVANEAAEAVTTLGAMYVQPVSRGPLFYKNVRNLAGHGDYGHAPHARRTVLVQCPEVTGQSARCDEGANRGCP
jgi:hypothetical protein